MLYKVFTGLILILLAYLFYTRLVAVYLTQRYYEKQGARKVPGCLPLIGNMMSIISLAQEAETKQLNILLSEAVARGFKQAHVPVAILTLFHKPYLIIQDPKMLRDIYVTQNAILEKTEFVYDLTYDLLGDSFVMTKSDDIWKLKRKICSHAFYKEKLEGMTEVMRNVTLDKIEQLNRLSSSPQVEINLTKELSDIFTRIIITICFGEDLSDSMHQYINEDGTRTLLSLQFVLRGIFMRLIKKGANPIRALTSRFDRCCLTASERYNRRNCEVVKDYIRIYIQQRKKGLNKSQFKTGQDFLDYLLADEFFSQSDQLIVDEILDFFVAATQTTASTTQTILHFLTQSQSHQQRFRSELVKTCGQDKSRDSLFKAFSNSKTQDIEMFTNLWNEALRFEPTATVSSFQYFTKDVTIGDYRLRAGDVFVVHIKGIHHNQNEWQRPQEFLPERWESDHPLSYTPAGNKRDPMSFVPFTGGKRVCFGKTFAEISGRIVTTLLINAFRFEFSNKKFMTEFPHFSVMATKDVDVFVKLTPQ